MKLYGRTGVIKKDTSHDDVINMLIRYGAPAIGSNPLTFNTRDYDVYKETNIATEDYCYIWAIKSKH